LNLTASNTQKRNAKYGASAGNANSKWYSRSMGILGSLLLIFLVMHLKHFWVVSRFTNEIQEAAGSTLFDEMVFVFADPIPVFVYVIGCISLAYHLLHGFQSAFQSLGINHPAYSPIIKSIGAGFSIIVPLVFAAMPIAMHLGWIK
jgi:succinate dehydrogenase / fumarate reductase cytochrome b subunit